MELVFLIWIGVALYLWGHFKLTNTLDGYVEGAPQSTFPGALLWPFFFFHSLFKVGRERLAIFISNFKAKQ